MSAAPAVVITSYNLDRGSIRSSIISLEGHVATRRERRVPFSRENLCARGERESDRKCNHVSAKYVGFSASANINLKASTRSSKLALRLTYFFRSFEPGRCLMFFSGN